MMNENTTDIELVDLQMGEPLATLLLWRVQQLCVPRQHPEQPQHVEFFNFFWSCPFCVICNTGLPVENSSLLQLCGHG